MPPAPAELVVGPDETGLTSSRALRESEARYRALYDTVPVGIFSADADGRITAANPAFVRMLGRASEDELVGRDCGELHADLDAWLELWSDAQASGSVRERDVVYRSTDGGSVWARQSLRAVHDADGAVVGFESTVEDVSARRLAEEAETAAEARFRGLVEQSLVGTFIVQDGGIIYANPKMCEIFGFSATELVHLGSFVRLVVDDVERREVEKRLRRLLEDNGPGESLSFRARRGDGRIIDVEVHVSPMRANGGSALIGMVLDITRRKETEARLVHRALHDPLTGLPNRLLFMERLEHAVARGQRPGARAFGLLFLDLDRFKEINDTFGHHAGDEFLVVTAERLRKVVRPGDTVARMGGDEFAVLLEELEDATDATRVADRMATELAAPASVNGYDARTTASMGIVLSSRTHDGPEELLRSADLAMYRAKSAGAGRYEVFDRAMHADVVARLQLEADLRDALERDEFRLHYQPIVSLDTGAISGYEALVRWQHPDRGLVTPGEFIPLAEATGLIVPIGRWVLREACRQLSVWQGSHPAHRRLSMGVNLSAKQFLRPEFIQEIDATLQDTGMDPHSLRLEITESMIMENADTSATFLHRMRALGIQLYLDDFGTGYSSVSHLHRLPLDTLKIDRSFVSRIGLKHRDAHLARTIVNLAHDLGVEVVSEGVETVGQLRALQQLGCQFGQGYLISRPLDAESAELLLSAETTPWGHYWTDPDRDEQSTLGPPRGDAT